MTPRFAITRIRTFVVFVLLNLLLLLWVVPQMPPEPIYRAVNEAADPLIPLEKGKPITFSFSAQAPKINAILLQYLFTDGSKGSHLTATIENRTRQAILAEEELTYGDLKQIEFAPNNAAGDEISVTVAVSQSVKEENPAIQQALKRCFYKPKYPLSVSIGGEPQDAKELRPIFTVKYQESAAVFLWLWPVMIVVLVWMFFTANHDIHQRMIWYLVVGLLLTTTSLLMFSGRIYQQWDFVDPDSYGNYAEKLVTWLTEPQSRAEAQKWMHEFAHGHVPLIPLLLAVAYLMGVPHLLAYAFLVSTSSFGILLLVDWIAKLRLKFTARTSLLVVALLATNLVFAKSFARPSTDMISLVLVVAGLAITHLRYERRFTLKENLWFAVLLFLICLSRPPGVGYAVLIGIAALGADASRRRGLLAPGLLRHGLQIAVPVGMMLAVSWFELDWFHNFELNLEKSKQFHDRIDFATFWPRAVTIFLPLLLVMPFLWRRSKFPVHLHAGFIVAALIMLWAVKAPWILRVMLPLLPSVCLVVGSALRDRKRGWIPFSFAVAIIVLNLALLFYEYRLPLFPSEGIRDFIYY